MSLQLKATHMANLTSKGQGYSMCLGGKKIYWVDKPNEYHKVYTLGLLFPLTGMPISPFLTNSNSSHFSRFSSNVTFSRNSLSLLRLCFSSSPKALLSKLSYIVFYINKANRLGAIYYVLLIFVCSIGLSTMT